MSRIDYNRVRRAAIRGDESALPEMLRYATRADLYQDALEVLALYRPEPGFFTDSRLSKASTHAAKMALRAFGVDLDDWKHAFVVDPALIADYQLYSLEPRDLRLPYRAVPAGFDDWAYPEMQQTLGAQKVRSSLAREARDWANSLRYYYRDILLVMAPVGDPNVLPQWMFQMTEENSRPIDLIHRVYGLPALALEDQDAYQFELNNPEYGILAEPAEWQEWFYDAAESLPNQLPAQNIYAAGGNSPQVTSAATLREIYDLYVKILTGAYGSIQELAYAMDAYHVLDDFYLIQAGRFQPLPLETNYTVNWASKPMSSEEKQALFDSIEGARADVDPWVTIEEIVPVYTDTEALVYTDSVEWPYDVKVVPRLKR